MQKKDDPKDQITERLEHADFSRAAKGRAALKARLMKQTTSPRPRLLRLTLEVGGMAILALAFLFTVSRLVNNRPASPAANTPIPTSSLSPTSLPPTAQPTPEPTAGGLSLSMDSSPDAVRLAISQPSWQTLWAEIELDKSGAGTQRAYSQAWLENGGRGLVLSTELVSTEANFNLDFGVSSVALLSGKNVTNYDRATGEITTAPAQETLDGAASLAGSSPALDLVYPGFLYILSSEPRPLRMETMLGRPALVADWGNSRLWVDSETGLLLRAERYTGEVGNSPLDSVLLMRKVMVDPLLDDAVFNPPYLNELTFVEAPKLASPGPAPTPFAGVSTHGWIYFQAAAQAPFEWKVYKLPADCLVWNASCPDPQQLPGNPNLQITGLYWAPDRSLAIYSDTNNNQIVGFDPATRQFPRLLQGFFQPQLIWSPDSSQVAALTEGVDAYDMGLVVIQRDGWTVRAVPTTLRGEKQVYGWLDEHTLAVGIPNIGTFKGTPPAGGWAAAGTQPGLYRVNVDTGQSSLMPLDIVQQNDIGSLSPDGKQFAYLKWTNNKASIFIASVDGKETHAIGYEGYYPTWSPDGRWVLFQTYLGTDPNQQGITTLYAVRPSGAELKKVYASHGTLQATWSPDSTHLLVLDNGPEQPIGSKSMTVFDLGNNTSAQWIPPIKSDLFDLLGWQP